MRSPHLSKALRCVMTCSVSFAPFSSTLCMVTADLLAVINEVRANKGALPLQSLASEQRLREDIGFDSLDLAELTARLDEKFGVDVFADGIVTTLGEVQDKVDRSRAS